MSWPEPIPGLVLRYSYLWKSEHDAGREEGIKDRPCAIVLVREDDDGKIKIQVLLVTHSMPIDKKIAIELPSVIKRRLGLDSERSWIVISETNEFSWPGPDLRTLPDRDVSTITYGVLPPKFFDYVRDRFFEYQIKVGSGIVSAR